MQNLELHRECTVLDSKLGESQIVFCGMLKLVEELECKFTSMLKDIALKEKTIDVDLDALLEESRKLDERHKRMASNIVLEVYDLCADKAMLEYALQEEQEKARLYDTELDNLGAEYEVMVQNYVEELAASRANQETLMGRVRGLKEELKAFELERLKATEEIYELEVQLQKTKMLQDEIFILKRSLYESEFEFRRLKASYQMLSLECDELKAKNVSYNRRISTTEKVTSELEDCKCSKIELEEKNLRLQWNLTIKEASCHNNAQLKYEVAQIKDWHLRILEGMLCANLFWSSLRTLRLSNKLIASGISSEKLLLDKSMLSSKPKFPMLLVNEPEI
ncbi:hypothetical protein JHK87_039239 [Glycine soja]|nr:hypothetical protein JHK87_039239 [Glycine soja]